MTHVPDDTLVLLAYRELPDETMDAVQAHVGECDACHARFAELERARVATDWALRRGPRRVARWVGVAVAAAAGIAAVLLAGRTPSDDARDGWRPITAWSATAGYVAGGRALVAIDSQLTRLEQEIRNVRH